MSTPLEIRVVLNSQTPVYRQIVDAVRSYCVAGTLPPGAKLPTVRELAANLGIHFNTVAEAYRTLADEGWVIIEGRRGVSVLDRRRPRTPGLDARADQGTRLRHLIAELHAKGFSKDWIRQEVLSALEATKKCTS